MLPASVRERCAELVGQVGEVEPLGGLSGSSVLLVHGHRGRVVAKSATPRERAVYADLATVLDEVGIRLPHRYAEVDGWILLEHLPRPLPRERWGADPEVVGILRRLHGLSPDVLGTIEPFRPRWDDALDAAARERLPLTDAGSATLSVVRRRAEPLLEPLVVVSADPNPANWRLDERGRPVLLDWERIGLATPAVDLAILLPGLPTGDEARAVVSAYDVPGVDAVDVLAANAWTLVEFAAETEPDTDRAAVVSSLAPGLDQWLTTLDRLLPRD